MYYNFLAFSHIIWGPLQHQQTKNYQLLLMESIHESRHEKHQLLTFGVGLENNTVGFFSFPK